MVQDAVKRALHADAPIPAGLIELPAAEETVVVEDAPDEAASEAAAEYTAADAAEASDAGEKE
jgi:hypothetical protein